MPIFNPIIYGGESGDVFGEEVQGVAGEDLVKGDLVGLFKEPNLIQNLTNFDISNKFFFDKGNKYYTMGQTIKIYDTHTNNLLEERSKPTYCYGCNNLEQPDIDYLCYYDITSKDLTIYKWNKVSSEYEVAKTFLEIELKLDASGTNYRVLDETCITPSIMKDYLVFIITYKTTAGYYMVYAKAISKTTFQISTYLPNSTSKNSAYVQEIICDYNRNRFLVCAGNHQGSAGMSTQRVHYIDLANNETIHATSFYVGAFFKVHFYLNGGKGFIGINTTNLSYTSSAYRGVYMVNDFGQVYNIDEYNPPYWLISASEDFNEVILLNSTNQNIYLANVALKTLTLITDPSKIPNYYQPRESNSHLMPMKENGAIKIIMRYQAEFASKIAKITSFTSTFRKLNHVGYGLYSYLGVVKDDALKGTLATVYKLIDY